jgi:hypothetical protein
MRAVRTELVTLYKKLNLVILVGTDVRSSFFRRDLSRHDVRRQNNNYRRTTTQIRAKKIDTVSKGQKTFTRHFRPHLYATVPWLCGCSQLNKLFCWPCILFSKEKTTWTTSGYDDLHNFHKSGKRHSNAVAHILSLKNLELFGKNQRTEFSLSEQHRLSVRHNEQVWKNRIMLTHLIRVVCVLGKLGLAFRGHDESETSVNRGN